MSRELRAYFDTSVVVKRYVCEPGGPEARRLLRRHRVLSSAILPVELASALCRRREAGDLAARDLEAILTQIERDRRAWELVEAARPVLERARRIVVDAGMRTLDALHLASAVTLHREGLRIPFVTADARQSAAAEYLGLEVVSLG